VAQRPPWGVAHNAVAIVLVALLLCLALPGHAGAQATPVANTDLPAYTIDVDLTTTNRTIAGSLSLEWTNHTGEDQRDLWFRVYPNADYYGDAETVVDAVTIDGADVRPYSRSRRNRQRSRPDSG
jgi:hypothetical protein